MKTNIRYANIMIMALAIAQILDTVISALRVFEVNVLKVSIVFLNAWNLENDDKSYEEKSLKLHHVSLTHL